MTKSEQIVNAVISELEHRKGFDEFWYSIEEDIQDDIKAALKGAVERYVKD